MISALTLVICCSKTSLHQATFTERQLRWRAGAALSQRGTKGSNFKGKMG